MWLARDKDKSLYVYINKPKKGFIFWYTTMKDSMELDSNLFPNVLWTDKKPTEVDIVIKYKTNKPKPSLFSCINKQILEAITKLTELRIEINNLQKNENSSY